MKNLFFLILLIASSCMTHVKFDGIENKRDDVFHSSNIVKVEFVFIEGCPDNNKCDSNRLINTHGSGTIIDKDVNNTATILTVGHLCHEFVTSLNKFGKERNLLKIYNNKMETYKAEIATYHIKNDICLLKARDYIHQIEKISLRTNKIIPGEEIFNIGAPTGLFSYNMVNRFRGFYAGHIALGTEANIKNVFNFPAVEGSSGSPIFDDKGLLIGIVSMFSKDFNYIILSPSLSQLGEIL